LRTATGVSEIRTFWIGALTNVLETEPNNEPAKAQLIPLNSTVTGTVPSEDVDYFQVRVEQGTRLSAEIEAMRLGRGVFDPYLCILNKQGQVLAAAEDTPLLYQDAAVSLMAPESGDYLILVRETSFGGRDDFHYRLHVGNFPRPTAVFPAGARTGTKVQARFIGDPAGDFQQELQLPAEPQSKFPVFAQQSIPTQAASPVPTQPPGADGSLAPSPNWIHLTTYPTATETEPNDTREQVPSASAQDPPILYNGIIGQPGDQDWFRFRARKGQSLQIAVFARRLRSPLDSMIQVVNAKGTALADNDDGAGPDSVLTFKPDEDGEYAVLVRDHLKRGGPSFVYCLEIAPAAPSLTVKIPEVARNDTQSRQYIAVPRGNRFATLISAKRANFSGDLDFHIQGLPEGVQLHAQTLPARLDQFPLVFEASSNAVVAGKLLDLTATTTTSTTNAPTGHYRNDIELVQGPNNTSYIATTVDHLLVAVTEAAPFKIRIVDPKIPLLQAGSMDLKIAVERAPGFAEPITVKLVWNPPGVTSQPDLAIPKDADSGIYVLNAKSDAEMRSWPVAVLGSAKVNGGELFVSSQLATIEIGPPFVGAKIETVSCSPGRSTNILVKLEQLNPFPGHATIKLMGLSDKVSVSEQQISKEDKEVSFPVEVDPTCPTGSQRNLFCVVTVKKDGEVLSHNAGQGGVLRVVPARKQTESSETKKVAKNP
jgi:hypothetical protein